MKRPTRSVFIFTLALSMVLSLLPGCEKAPTAKVSFSQEEYLQDYDHMWQVLEDNYLYFPILEAQGLDIASIQASTRTQVETGVKTVAEFYDTLTAMFQRLYCYAHLNVLSPEGYSVYQDYYTRDGEENSPWGRVILDDPQVQATYACLTTDTPNQTVPEFSSIEATYDQVRKAVTFTIPTFDYFLVQQEQDFIADYLNTLENAEVRHIIFDITANRGGDDSFWKENLVAPFGGDFHWTSWWYLKNSPLSQEFYFQNAAPDQAYPDASSLVPQPLSAMPKDHPAPDFAEALGLTHFAVVENSISFEPTLPEQYLDAKRWVLIDQNTYSSADSFSEFCKITGWATLVGRSTGGDGGSSAPVLFALPNTGLLVQFSAAATETASGTLNVQYGTAPDCPVSVMESIQGACNRLIDVWENDE